MSVKLPNGTLISLANGYGSAVNITAITNANPAVATAAGHTFQVGDYVEITSGWSRLTDKVVRVSAVAGNDFTLEGYDTTLTDIYPAGGGIGSAREISGWTQMSQILSSSSNGGEQQFLEYQFLEADAQKRIPTFKSASGLTFTVADDPTLPGYIVAAAANDDRRNRAVMANLAGGSKILYNAFISVNKTPSLTVNELMQVEVTMSLLAEPVRYAA